MEASYRDHMGDDLSVVNAAKVSFGKRSEWVRRDLCGDEISWFEGESRKILSEKDQGLIQFLARGCTSGDWEALVGKVEVRGYNIWWLDEVR